MPRTYDLHLTFGQMETLRKILEEKRDTCERVLNLEGEHATSEGMKTVYVLEIERIQGVLDQF